MKLTAITAANKLKAALQTYENEKIKACTKELQEQMYKVSTNVYINVEGSKLDQNLKEESAGAEPKVSVDGDEPSEDDLFGWFQQ